MTVPIETEKLTKSYGPNRGIVDLDLEVDEGEVFGFLGPNGAGKTTTIRTLLDHLRPTSGRARVPPAAAQAATPPDRVRSFFGVDGPEPRCKIGWIRIPGGAVRSRSVRPPDRASSTAVRR